MSAHRGVVEVSYDRGSISFKQRNSFQSRNAAMIRLIEKAWLLHFKGNGPPGERKAFSLYTDDEFSEDSDYSFAVKRPEDAGRSMPNFIFDSWPECGVDSYEAVFSEMLSCGDRPPEDERVFWIGNISCPLKGYDNRRMGQSVASKHGAMLDFRSVEWPTNPAEAKNTKGYVSLPDHCRHRVLIDFGGMGFSARIPLLLASGRAVILVGHPQEAWFYWDGTLEPWVHYVPCGSKDGSDVSEDKIYEAVKWTFDNKGACSEIGARGRKFALENLTHSAAVSRIGNMIVRHSEARS